jgi:hypothetical protein
MAQKMTKTAMALSRAGKEMKKNPPSILAKTARKAGPMAAERQRKAIFLSKARAFGARIPKNGSDQMARRKIQMMIRRVPTGTKSMK